jgi:hypothetical protein
MATGAGLAEWEQTHGKKKAKFVLTSTGLLMEGLTFESNCHTPGRMSSAVLHTLGRTKQFALRANTLVLWFSDTDDGNDTTAADG